MIRRPRPALERDVRGFLRAVDARDRAPAYLLAAPGVAWWLTWLCCILELRRFEHGNPLGAGVIAAVALLLLAGVAATFGLASLLAVRTGFAWRLLLFAINLSGPVFMFAG